MEYFKGAKGEWVSEGFTVNSKSYSVCDINLTSGQGYGEAVANARLISASPELLSAAVSAWTMLSDIPNEAMDESLRDTVDGLNAAISKALGYKIGNK